LGQQARQVVDVSGNVCIEDVLGGLDTGAGALPDLSLCVLGADVEVEGVVVVVELLDDGEGVGLVETCGP
jgi:hypothetical protein